MICRHFAPTGGLSYDWRATEVRLNRWPQYLTDIDGLTIHFFHLQSSSPSAVPMILTHGWPGSFLEFEEVMEQLVGSQTLGASRPAPTSTSWCRRCRGTASAASPRARAGACTELQMHGRS